MIEGQLIELYPDLTTTAIIEAIATHLNTMDAEGKDRIAVFGAVADETKANLLKLTTETGG